jgi:hypothetical protein
MAGLVARLRRGRLRGSSEEFLIARAAAAAIILAAATLTACGGSTGKTNAPAATTSATTEASTSQPTRTKTCDPGPDLLVREKAPGVPISAQLLGSVSILDCSPTVDYLQKTTPTGSGYCTWAAMSSDNPEYNVDAQPAPRLKKVIAVFGDGC